MGERDLGAKTSQMRDRQEHASRRGEPLGDAGDTDGTIAEVLPEEAIEAREDEDLAEAKAIDAADVREDDYVQDGSVYDLNQHVTSDDLRRAIDREGTGAEPRASSDEAPKRPRPRSRDAEKH